MEFTKPVDLLSGIDNDTVVSLAIDKNRPSEVPLTFREASSMIMEAIRKNRVQPDLEMVAALMVNLPNFDATNPEVPDAMSYLSTFMRQNSKPSDPIFEYFSGDQLSEVDQLVKEVLERILVSESTSSLVRESAGLLLQNFHRMGNSLQFREWNINDIFNIVVQDYYPRSVVAIAEYFRKNFNRINKENFYLDLALYTTELQALNSVIMQLYENSFLSETAREGAAALRSFLVQKEREEDQTESLDEIGVHRALEYLDAFRSPCLSEKLRTAAEILRPYLNDSMPWSYAFGDTSSRGNPYELMVNALINMKNIEISEKLSRVLDHFIYHAKSSGILGEPSVLYEHGIIFQREDSNEVELDVYSLLAKLPNVFQDKRFAPLLTFFAKPNLIDYLGHRLNIFKYTKPRDLLMALLRTASDKPAVRTDEKLYKALRVGIAILEEPTLVNIYSSEELQNVLKILPAVDIDPRYIPIKLLFKKENLFSHISPSFSLAGLETPIQHINLILNTIALKPIDERLEEAINFALTNLEGPQLPARSYTQEDFAYLVNNLFRNHKNIEVAILKSPVYKAVSDWKIPVNGMPESVLARILSYPIKSLSKNPELSSVIVEAEKLLEVKTTQEIELLKKKTLNDMVEYLPETAELRPVNLLLKKANLAMFLPNRTLSTLESKQPREALIFLLKNFLSSRHNKRKTLLTKRLQLAMKSVEKSTQPVARGVSSVYTEELLNPLAEKYEPLWMNFQEFNGSSTFGNNDLTFEQLLLRLRDDKRNRKLSEAAGLALEEIYYGVKSGMIPAIRDTEILAALSLLPNDPGIDPLKKLLTPSWVLDVLPRDFQRTEYPSKGQILRIILLMTKQRAEIRENPTLMSAITRAANSLINWQHDLRPFRKLVTVIKETLYDPVLAILRPQNLNRLQLNFTFDYRQSSKQLLVRLLHNLMLHPKITGDSHIMHVLYAVRQDVLNFGLDSDLLWILDDAGIPYVPSLAPVRLFLHTNTATSRLGPLAYRENSDAERYDTLLVLLSNEKTVQANQDLRESVLELKNIVPSFKNPLATNETDIKDIFNAIPDETLAKYPDVRNLSRDSDTLKNLVPYSEILNSPQPLMMLLLKLGQLPKVTKNKSLTDQISELYEGLGDALYNPVISGFHLRPLLRELHHARQINLDYMLRIIDPEMLSTLLPEDFSYDRAEDQSVLLSDILQGILAERVLVSGTELETHISSLYRDLAMLSKPEYKAKNLLLSDREVNDMLKFIPSFGEFETIRYIIETRETFDRMPQSFDWIKYPTPLKKLKRILEFMKRQSEDDYNLHESVLALDRHLVQEYFFISDNDLRMLQGALNDLSVDRDLVPLRLFLTVDNLVVYLPSNISIEGFESPHKALDLVLQILRDNKNLGKDKLLQNSISAAIKAVKKHRFLLEGKELDNSSIRKVASNRLTKYDLRFILNLDLNSRQIQNYLDPGKLMNVLPKSFSFLTKSTYKTKVLHLLKYLINKEFGPVEELKKIVLTVNGLNDLCNIESADLEPLIAAINESITGVDFKLIKKYWTIRKLAKILPGNFNISNSTNEQEALLKLIRASSYGLGSVNMKGILEFEKLLKALQRPSYSMRKQNPIITPAELKLLIEEIPFEKCKNIQPLRQSLEVNLTLNMLPLSLNLTLLKTRKSKLLEILKYLKKHPDSSGFREMLKLAEKCVEKMQNVPKLSDRDIGELFKSSELKDQDQTALLENCKAADLAEYLPINFDIKTMKSYKGKLQAIIDNCKKLNTANITIKIALKNAEIFLAKLPAADLSREELDQFFDEICCYNYTSIKPLIMFAARNDLLSLLPKRLNLNSKSTVKYKLLALITALRNVHQFQNEKMNHALETAKNIVHELRSRPLIEEDHIKILKKLPTMMAQQVRPFAKIFVLRNLIKVVPPSFDISDYETERTRLALLLKYSKNMDQVKTQESYAASLAFAQRTLLREAEKETLEHLNEIIENVDEQIPLMLWLKNKEREFFDGIRIPYGIEYLKVEERLRVVLKFLVRKRKNLRSSSLVESIESLISQLSVGEPTDYEILEAINEIPNLDNNQELKTYLSCKDIQKRAESLTLTPEHTAKRLLLDLLILAREVTVDEEIISAMDRIVVDVQRAVWDSEAAELFKQIPNYKFHMKKVEAIRFYYISHGPDVIFGAGYRVELPTTIERLKKLVSIVLTSPKLLKNVELKTSVNYLKEILTNNTKSENQRPQKTMQDIDTKSLFTVLPKTGSERTILGLLKFFADPELINALSKAINPSQYKSQGRLMKEIVSFGLTLEKVKRDPERLKALKYVKDKILMTGSGALPVKLNTLSKHSSINPDLIGVLKSVDIRSANLSVLIPIAKFFDTKYNPLIDGRGFDHEAHVTRGAYLKALLEHLMANSDVQQEIKRHAKVLLNYVRLDGPGAAPVDLNEDSIMPDNRIFYGEWYADHPQVDTLPARHLQQGNLPYDIYPHFRSYFRRNYWEEAPTSYPDLRSQPPAISLKRLMQEEDELPQFFENERSALWTSVDRISNPSLNQEKSESEEKDEDESKWSQEMVERQDTLKKSIKNTLGFIRRILPQSNYVDITRQAKHGNSTKRGAASKLIKGSTVSSHHTTLNEATFDPESATFSPDKVLVDVEARINEASMNRIAPEERVFITEEEAAKLKKKKRRLIRPLNVNSRELLKSDSKTAVIPHNVSSSPSKVNLESRKLFVRNNTEADLDLTKWISNEHIALEDLKNSKGDYKTVKKDLSQAKIGVYRILTDEFSEGKTTIIESGITDSTPVLQASTLPHSELLESSSRENVTKFGADSVKGEMANRQVTDDMTVEDFIAHNEQYGTLGTTLPPEVIDQKKMIRGRELMTLGSTAQKTSDEARIATEEKRSMKKSIENRSLSSSMIDVEQLFEVKSFPCNTENTKSHPVKKRKAEAESIHRFVSLDEDYLDVPIAAELGAVSDSSDYGNFHRIYPRLEKMYDGAFGRK